MNNQKKINFRFNKNKFKNWYYRSRYVGIQLVIEFAKKKILNRMF